MPACDETQTLHNIGKTLSFDFQMNSLIQLQISWNQDLLGVKGINEFCGVNQGQPGN
jgi:hypothetical protein